MKNVSILDRLKQKYGYKLTDQTPINKIPSIVNSLEWKYLKNELKYVNHKHENFNEFLDEHQQRGLCICGLNNCKESYVNWTSGW